MCIFNSNGFIIEKTHNLYIYIYNSVRLKLVVRDLGKYYCMGATKLSRITNYGSGSVLHGLKSTV